MKPPKPRYQITWNPAIVFNFLKSWTPNEKLSLEKITKKLITILALYTAQRAQTLSLIKLKNIFKYENEIIIKIPDRIKTTAKNKFQPCLNIPFMPEHEELCPAKILNCYLNITKNLRPKNDDKLFLTFKKPYHAASTQTISRWIKQTIGEAGVDTNIFSAHSTRHAATSKAIKNGIDLETIFRTACWSKNSKVFEKFYNLPTEKESFVSGVIQNL